MSTKPNWVIQYNNISKEEEEDFIAVISRDGNNLNEKEFVFAAVGIYFTKDREGRKYDRHIKVSKHSLIYLYLCIFLYLYFLPLFYPIYLFTFI
jgi:hypothetical protein